MKLFPFFMALIFLTLGSIFAASIWSVAISWLVFCGGAFTLALTDGICSELGSTPAAKPADPAEEQRS